MFSTKAPRAIIHDYMNCFYVIICEKKVYVVDDLSFNLKREVVGNYEQATVNVDGKILLINDLNHMLMIDPEDKNWSFTINGGESKIDVPKFSSMGLYLACKMVNPYGVGVWMIDKQESLFTFNENLKFSDFSAIDSKF